MASTKAIIEEARTLIKQNQLEKTVELLLSNIDNSDLNKDIINVAGKLSSLQSRNLSGILSHADFNLEENAIRQNLIDILQMLGQTDNLTPETKHGSPPDSKKDSPMTNQSKDKKKLTQTLLYKPIRELASTRNKGSQGENTVSIGRLFSTKTQFKNTQGGKRNSIKSCLQEK